MSKPKLSKEQIDRAYNMYYNYDKSRPKPTIAYIAHLFSVSTNTMFVALNREHYNRSKPSTIEQSIHP